LGPKIEPSFLPVAGNLNSTEDVGKDLLPQEVTRKELPW